MVVLGITEQGKRPTEEMLLAVGSFVVADYGPSAVEIHFSRI